MAARRALLALIALVLLLALPVSAQTPGIHNPATPSPVTLYMHIIDIQDFPINTQKPVDGYTVSNAMGLMTSTTSCLPDAGAVDTSQAWHTAYGYSSPSYVEYQIQQGNKPRVHGERGISYDAHLDQGTPFTLYWYMTTQSVATSPEGVPDPSAVPIVLANVVVTATIRAGDGISVNDHLYNTGPMLVNGETIPATLAGPEVLPGTGLAEPTHTKALGQLPDGKWLYEFAVPMAIEAPIIPRDTGYNLRIDVRMDNPACTNGVDAALMPNLVRIHSDAEHRPRMDFAVTNPLRIEALHPQFVGDDLVVHVAMNAVWGNYDIAEVSTYTPEVTADDMKLDIAGPTEAKGLYLHNIVQSTNPHYMHQDAVTLSFVWPYKVDQASDGPYTISLLVRNDQRTATATAEAVFELGRDVATACTEKGCIEEGPGPRATDNEAPGLAAPLLALAALGLAALARRRT
ncbi:MAG: hypothetical protein WC876_07105 [Candidatus Thermoplasmatota archaeon]|jgi:hypothetical protein